MFGNRPAPDVGSAVALELPGVGLLNATVARADGEKCARCWHFTTDVGADSQWPTVCARCAQHVRQTATA